MFNQILRRIVEKLEYKDPVEILVGIRDDMFRIQRHGLSSKEDKQILEVYQGAYLAMFVKLVANENQGIQVSIFEYEDFDCVIRTTDSKGEINYLPVQLKGLPNHQQNKSITLQGVVNRFGKYGSSPHLVGGVWINRDIKVDLKSLVFDGLRIGQLWIFGDRPDGLVQATGGLLDWWKNGWCTHVEVKDLIPTFKQHYFKDQP